MAKYHKRYFVRCVDMIENCIDVPINVYSRHSLWSWAAAGMTVTVDSCHSLSSCGWP